MTEEQVRILRAKALDPADPIGQAIAVALLVAEVRRLQARLGPEAPPRCFPVKLARAKARALSLAWDTYHDLGRWRRVPGGYQARCSCHATLRLEGEDGAWYARGALITDHCAHHHYCAPEGCPAGDAYRRAHPRS